MKKRGYNLRGQVMGMPFILIFSLILVAVAIFVGFWGIKTFLERAEQANIHDFTNQLQYDIINVWDKEAASKTVTLALSKKFQFVCFTNQSISCNIQEGFVPSDFCSETIDWGSGNDNLFLYPGGTAEKYDSKTAWHIKCGTKECLNIEKTICFPVENGKVTLKLIKESGKATVKIFKVT